MSPWPDSLMKALLHMLLYDQMRDPGRLRSLCYYSSTQMILESTTAVLWSLGNLTCHLPNCLNKKMITKFKAGDLLDIRCLYDLKRNVASWGFFNCAILRKPLLKEWVLMRLISSPYFSFLRLHRASCHLCDPYRYSPSSRPVPSLNLVASWGSCCLHNSQCNSIKCWRLMLHL